MPKREFQKKTIVIALGGSIVHPDQINTAYVKALKKFLINQTNAGKKFIIVIGGGALARRFQIAAENIGSITEEQKDWLGIHSTRLNAQLLRAVFGKDLTDETVIHRRFKFRRLRSKPITIASGWRPGASTDHVAAVLTKDYNADCFIVAGKPSHVFDKDPSKYRSAKPFEDLAWAEYQKIIPPKWTPGLHVPIDPTATAFAKQNKLTGIVISGEDLKNFEALLSGKDFAGTILQ